MPSSQPNKDRPAGHPRFSSTMRIDLTAEADENSVVSPPPPLAEQPMAPTESNEIHGGTDFRELFESVYDAAIITEPDGTIVCANARAEEFFQFPAKQFCGMHITDLISGSNESLMPTINKSLQNDRFILIQAYCGRADGSVFPAEVSVNILKLSNQQRISFFIRDVTFRKDAEEKLRTGHAAIQNSGNGIGVTDTTGKLDYFNPAMAKLLCIQDQEASPPINQFLCNPDIGASIQKTILAGRPWSGELQMRCTNEATLVVLASIAPNLDADGEVMGMVWSLLDISDQKRIQNELRQHNAQLADDLNLANEFQLAFIQREYPTFPSGVPLSESVIELGHAYLPSGAVGGDFFEIFSVSLNRVGIFISDVMGHGVRSALIVATIRGLIEELGPFRYDPAAFLTHMNRDLARIISHPGQTMFASAFYMVLDLTNGNITWASAGHPAPLLLQEVDHTVTSLTDSKNQISSEPALGLFPNTQFHAHTSSIEPKDMILLYTDGISEVESAKDDSIFDVSGLSQTLERMADHSVKECLQEIIADAEAFSGSSHFDDDVCLIGLRLRSFLKTSM